MIRKLLTIALVCALALPVSARPGPDSNYNLAISAGGGGGFTLISHTKVVGNGSQTTPSINTTGANLIVAIQTSANNAALIPTDNQSNSYTQVGVTQDSGNSGVSMYFDFAPTTSASHTFTSNAVNAFGTLEILAFSGAVTSPLDQNNGTANGTSSASIQPGSITPTANGYLIVLGCTIASGSTYTFNSGFTISDSADFSGGVTFGGAAGYLVQGTAAAINPTCSVSAAQSSQAAIIASFKHP